MNGKNSDKFVIGGVGTRLVHESSDRTCTSIVWLNVQIFHKLALWSSRARVITICSSITKLLLEWRILIVKLLLELMIMILMNYRIVPWLKSIRFCRLGGYGSKRTVFHSIKSNCISRGNCSRTSCCLASASTKTIVTSSWSYSSLLDVITTTCS